MLKQNISNQNKFFLKTFFLLIIAGCGSNTQPQRTHWEYDPSTLTTYCKTMSELGIETSVQGTQNLKKIFVMPGRFHNFIVGFIGVFVSQLKDKGWLFIDSTTQAKGLNALEDILKATGTKDPDIVVFYHVDTDSGTHLPNWQNLKQEKFLKVVISEDLNYPSNIKFNQEAVHWADLILARYPEAFSKAVAPLEPLCVQFHHSASQYYLDAFVSSTDNKFSKALLSGATEAEFYPLRAAALNLMKKRPDLLTQRSHPGYVKKIDPSQEAKLYAQDLAKHKISIAGAVMGIYTPAPSIIAKHFEIAATGSVMLTDSFIEPLMKNLGFIANEHYLHASPETLEDVLTTWLKPENASRLEQIARNAHELVKNKHTMESQVRNFETVIVWATKQPRKI